MPNLQFIHNLQKLWYSCIIKINSENLYEKKKKKKNYGKRVTPIASIIDWIPKTIIATPPKISI